MIYIKDVGFQKKELSEKLLEKSLEACKKSMRIFLH